MFPYDDPAHEATRMALKEGDTAVLYVEHNHDRYVERVEITKCTPAFVWVGKSKFRRATGWQPNFRKSAKVMFLLYGLTDAAKEHFAQRDAEREQRVRDYEAQLAEKRERWQR